MKYPNHSGEIVFNGKHDFVFAPEINADVIPGAAAEKIKNRVKNSVKRHVSRIDGYIALTYFKAFDNLPDVFKWNSCSVFPVSRLHIFVLRSIA